MIPVDQELRQMLPLRLKWQAWIVDWLGRKSLRAFQRGRFVRGNFWRCLYIPWSRLHMKQHAKWYLVYFNDRRRREAQLN